MSFAVRDALRQFRILVLKSRDLQGSGRQQSNTPTDCSFFLEGRDYYVDQYYADGRTNRADAKIMKKTPSRGIEPQSPANYVDRKI